MKRITDYEQNQAKEKLQKDLDRNMTLLNAWQNVTRNYKKNGESFANMKQNFDGISFIDKSYKMHSKEREISVSALSNMNGYVSDYFNNYENVKYTNFTPSEDRIINEPCLEPYFYLNADEVEQKIQGKIAYYKERVSTIQKAIDGINEDLRIMSNLLDTMAEEISKLSPDMASYFKSKIIRNYY